MSIFYNRSYIDTIHVYEDIRNILASDKTEKERLEDLDLLKMRIAQLYKWDTGESILNWPHK